MATIIESVRNNKYSITIVFGGLCWMIEGLNRACRNFTENKFFSKYQVSYGLFLMQRYSNKNGRFMSISKIQQGIVKSMLVFPAGREGDCWIGIANSLQQLLFAPKKGNAGQTSKKVLSQNHNTKVQMSRRS